MYYREYPITPSQQAVNGALCIYVEGGKRDDSRRMLFGLSVLRSATEAQLEAALPFAEASQQVTRADIAAMFAGDFTGATTGTGRSAPPLFGTSNEGRR